MTDSEAPFIVTCRSGLLAGRQFKVFSSLTVGRESSCATVLDDPKVSRLHGTFSVREGKLFFADNRSTNGTFLNGERILEAEVVLGDVIRFGGSEFSLLMDEDFRTINVVHSDSMITGILAAEKVKPDALAEKFAQVFDYYKEHQPEVSEAERYELVRTQRMLNGLKTLYGISQSMSKVVPLTELLEQVGESLFELFAGAEDLVILLRATPEGKVAPRHATSRGGGELPEVAISKTVLEQAMEQKSTLIANDAAHDARLAQSDSILGLAVKSVMCAPLVSNDSVIGALYLQNREASVTYDEMDAELVTAFANQCAVAIENAFLCDTLQKHYHQTLQALVNAIEAKDAYTMGHTARVGGHAVGIGKAYGLDEARLKRLKMAADLHDIGKIGIKEGIINKPGALTETEYVTIKDHVEMGERILRPITYLQDLLPHIRGHHEKWDGSGYPDGLKGEECTLEGRILALADALDAMTSQRSYNKPLTFRQALDRIKEASGRHFDPAVVVAFECYLNESCLLSETEYEMKTVPVEVMPVGVAEPALDPKTSG